MKRVLLVCEFASNASTWRPARRALSASQWGGRCTAERVFGGTNVRRRGLAPGASGSNPEGRGSRWWPQNRRRTGAGIRRDPGAPLAPGAVGGRGASDGARGLAAGPPDLRFLGRRFAICGAESGDRGQCRSDGLLVAGPRNGHRGALVAGQRRAPAPSLVLDWLAHRGA